jgi:hypothetical protein
MDIELVGVIGNKGMKPRITWDWRKRQGKTVKAPFIRFSMFVEDKTKAPDRTTGRRPREVWQVILPETQRGQKLFEYLRPGRQVFVRGRATLAPGVGTNSEGQQQMYANAKCYMGEIQFLDSPPERVAERMLRTMHEDMKIIDDDQHKAMSDSVTNYYRRLDEEDPPRIIEDRTTTEASDRAPEEVDNDPDPDAPEFPDGVDDDPI